MTHWHDTLVDRPESDGAAYATGWTISGLAVLGTVIAVWLTTPPAGATTSTPCQLSWTSHGSSAGIGAHISRTRLAAGG